MLHYVHSFVYFSYVHFVQSHTIVGGILIFTTTYFAVSCQCERDVIINALISFICIHIYICVATFFTIYTMFIVYIFNMYFPFVRRAAVLTWPSHMLDRWNGILLAPWGTRTDAVSQAFTLTALTPTLPDSPPTLASVRLYSRSSLSTCLQ